ncbi:MAG: CBS domain-containing protein [Enhydrobacter sp.]|nr:CBS domain-containing protein [Enhydrobacter sp.]
MRQLRDIVFDQKPLILPPTATVKEACQAMRDRRAGSVLVAEADGTLVGIFTGRDAVCRVLAVGADATATRLRDVMTANPATLSPGETAIDALRLMWDKGFRHVPLLKAGKIVGVVSRGDFQGFEHSRHEQERELWEHMR